jgi:hypothetical protein
MLLPGRLRTLAAPALVTSALGAFNSLPFAVLLDGANFLNDSTLVRVTFGDGVSAPFACELNTALTTEHTLVCTTQLGAQGLGLRFTIDVAGQRVTGSDSLNFPREQPIISSIHGCGVEAGNGTAG